MTLARSVLLLATALVLVAGSYLTTGGGGDREGGPTLALLALEAAGPGVLSIDEQIELWGARFERDPRSSDIHRRHSRLRVLGRPRRFAAERGI